MRRAIGWQAESLQGLPQAALLAQVEKVGKLDGRSGTGLQLPFHGSLVLPEDFHAAARWQLASLEIQ